MFAPFTILRFLALVKNSIFCGLFTLHAS